MEQKKQKLKVNGVYSLVMCVRHNSLYVSYDVLKVS